MLKICYFGWDYMGFAVQVIRYSISPTVFLFNGRFLTVPRSIFEIVLHSAPLGVITQTKNERDEK